MSKNNQYYFSNNVFFISTNVGKSASDVMDALSEKYPELILPIKKENINREISRTVISKEEFPALTLAKKNGLISYALSVTADDFSKLHESIADEKSVLEIEFLKEIEEQFPEKIILVETLMPAKTLSKVCYERNGIKNVLCINNDSNDIYSEFVNDNFNGENEMIEISKQIYPDKQDNYKNIKECVVKVYGNKYLESFNDNGIKVISKSIGDNNVLNEVENYFSLINKKAKVSPKIRCKF